MGAEVGRGITHWVWNGSKGASATVQYDSSDIDLTECSLAADCASPDTHPLTRTGASNSPRYRCPSANVTERLSALRNSGRIFR